jgi:uncharacterized membrane protein
MDKKILAAAVIGAAAVAGAVAVGLNTNKGTETAASVPKERCFGVAKAGENDCHAEDDAHACGGMSKVDNHGQDWKTVDGGTCVKMGGQLAAFGDPRPKETPAANETAPADGAPAAAPAASGTEGSGG